MSLYYQIKLTLLEDLHTGTGSGNSFTDAVLIRDRNDRPVIRATHIRGVLLEKAKEIATLNPECKEDVYGLFGQEGHGQRSSLSLSSLYCLDNPKKVFWTSASRRLHQRSPEEGTLRSREYVPAGTRFQGRLMLRDQQYRTLLEDCLRLLDRLGAERQRGSGLIRLEWEEYQPQPKIEVHWPHPIDEQRPIYLRLLWRNLEPLSLPVVGYTGNIIPTEAYIRGQTLWGALVDYLHHQNQSPAYLLEYEKGGISIGNAYPLPKLSIPKQADDLKHWQVLPFPLALKTPKPSSEKQGHWPWWAMDQSDEPVINELMPRPSQSSPQEKLKRPKERDFLFHSPAGWQRYKSMIIDHMRNSVPETRSSEDEGSLFNMEEIAEGTLFLSDLIFDSAETARKFLNDFEPLIHGQDWLGIGRGARPIQVEQALLFQPEQPSLPENEQVLTLVCSSDWIIRSTSLKTLPKQDEDSEKNGKKDRKKDEHELIRLPNLGFCDRLDFELLLEQLGLEQPDWLAQMNQQADWSWKATCDEGYSRAYNILTHAHRSPSLTILRGSMMRIQMPTDQLQILWQALQNKTYFGERFWEGYGRFQLFAGDLQVDRWAEKGQQKNYPSNTDEALFEKAENYYQNMPNKGVIIKDKKPSPSQWMEFFQLIQFLGADSAIARIERRAQQLSGLAWNNIDWEDMKKQLVGLQDEEKKQFLQALIRYVLKELKKGS